MAQARVNFLLSVGLIVFVALGCSKFVKDDSANTARDNSNSTVSTVNTKKTPSTDDGETASTSGAERQKPAAGKGNVQGKVLFNDQPVEGIEVRICENFSSIMGIKCDGETLTTKTDKEGIFVLADLEPQTYGGLTAKVFQTAYYVYPREGALSAQKFAVAADQTIFARDIHLFKDDIKTTNPKAGSKVDAKNLELKWDAYPDAAYYKITLYNDAGGLPPISKERVDDPSYSVTEPLPNGKYKLEVEAYNANNRKLATNSNDIKFTVTGGAEPTPKP